MSKIKYNGRVQSAPLLFSAVKYRTGSLALREGLPFGGTWAFSLLGPDLKLPSGRGNNPPSVGGPLWDRLHPQRGRPPLSFTTEPKQSWKRGHLVNSEWGGSGADWANLVPLTGAANSNHATIEEYMRKFSQASSLYEEAGPWRDQWIGIAYLVQVSIAPWSITRRKDDLYSYAPNFIKVAWRAVSIDKPTDVQVSALPGFFDKLLLADTRVASLPVLPFNAPSRPAALITLTGGCLPVGMNHSGEAVYAGPRGYPPAQPNGFDGDVEIHQS